MKGMFEIRWHGRGGQGSKTASILLAKIAAASGNYVQAFPEYGPERMGAPVLAYTRINNHPIHLHCQIEEPDLVVVLDPTLIGAVDVTANLNKGGDLIINSEKEPGRLKDTLGTGDDIKLFTVDANQISEEEIGRVFPNTPMLGALNKVINWLELTRFTELAGEELKRKFSGKAEVVSSNLRAIERAYQEVKGL